MKQRIRVAGIIKTKDGVLVLKRNRGRAEAPVFWELPTGKIKFGEQPEEALTRFLSEEVGLKVSSLKIKDAITFLALEGSSRLSNLYIIYEVSVGENPRPVLAGRYTSYKFLKDFTNTNIHLNEASLSVFEIIEGKITPARLSPRSTASAAAVYVDGASRGNPGPSGVGFHIVDSVGETIARGGEFIGFATSRVAEYYAMKTGIEKALDLGLKSVRFFSDSLMVINQLSGVFAVKNQDILPIYDSIQKLLAKFDSVSFTHLSRSDNEIADYEANSAIDSIIKTSA